MTRKKLSPEALRRTARRAARASSELENRAVPEGLVSPEEIDRFLAALGQPSDE